METWNFPRLVAIWLDWDVCSSASFDKITNKTSLLFLICPHRPIILFVVPRPFFFPILSSDIEWLHWAKHRFFTFVLPFPCFDSKNFETGKTKTMKPTVQPSKLTTIHDHCGCLKYVNGKDIETASSLVFFPLYDPSAIRREETSAVSTR